MGWFIRLIYVQVDVTASAPPTKGEVPKPLPGTDAATADSKTVMEMVVKQQADQGWGAKDPWASVPCGVVGNKPHTQVLPLLLGDAVLPCACVRVCVRVHLHVRTYGHVHAQEVPAVPWSIDT